MAAAAVVLVQGFVATGADETFIERPDFFDLLAGGSSLRETVEGGAVDDIGPLRILLASWTAEAETFRAAMAPYLLYS